ncbi:MAG: alpha-L-fucosidase [Kiritimatiellae bacterium]|nr:alpha-L-fucosidase [Kiritimatiellia bacterium]
MRIRIHLGLAAAILCMAGARAAEPDFAAAAARAEASRDERMAWWREARFGMFIHWGLYSVAADDWPGIPNGRYSEWLMSRGVPHEEYRRELTRRFDPNAYDPAAWAALAREAGMQYVVLTTKHHEGFSLWDSAATDYDVADNTPCGRDMLAPFVEAVRAAGLRVGFYYAILDWYHPDYVPRRKDNDSRPPAEPEVFGRYLDFMERQVRELLTGYGRVDVLWWDGGWEHNAEEQRAARLNGLAYALQPHILLGDRNGLPGDFATPEQKLPDPLPQRDWESCLTINGSWGYHRRDRNWKSSEELIRTLSLTATGGGNLLLNVGPDANGVIPEPQVTRLKEIGRWMRAHAPAIRGTARWPLAGGTPWGGGTVRVRPDGSGSLYLHLHRPSDAGSARLSGVRVEPKHIRWLEALAGAQASGELTPDADLVVRWNALPGAPAVAVIELEFDRPFLPAPELP